MRSNPLHFLSEKEAAVFARSEGITVAQLLARYPQIQIRVSKARKVTPKRKAQTNAAEAMRLFHSDKAASLQEAWDMVRGRKTLRGRVLANPGSKTKTAAQRNAAKAMRLFHSGQASSLQEAWDMVRGY